MYDVLTLKQYRDKFYPDVTPQMVRRYLRNALNGNSILKSNHHPRRLGKEWIIIITT